MNSGHFVGYVGGLAVALGIGAAAWLGTPTASADTSSHSASSGTAKSARPAQHTNTAASVKPGPTRKTVAPTSLATKRAAALSAGPANTLNVTIDYDTDNNPVAQVAVVNGATGAQIGTTITIEGTPGTPVYSTDGQHAVITTVYDEFDYKSTSHMAVINTDTGALVGELLTFTGDSTFSPPLIVTPDASQVLTVGVLYKASLAFARLVDTTTGAWEGFAIRGYPDGAPQLAPDGVHALITSTYYDYDLGDTYIEVMDTETGTPASLSAPPVRVDGLQFRNAIMTADGHAVITTTFTDSESGVVSTRVAVVDATTGRQIGTTQRLTGKILDSAPPALDGDRVVFRTTAGVKVTVNTGTGAVSTTPVASPWGFDVSTFAKTPIGQALTNVYRAIVVIGAFVVIPVVAVTVVGPVFYVASLLSYVSSLA
jgi:hypothetical protein